MGRSARLDKVRCSVCLKKGVHRRPVPIAVKRTGYNDYVTLKCFCGHIYKTVSRAAIRLAESQGFKF